MAGSTVSIHAGRLYFSAMRAGGEMDEKISHDPVAAFAAPPHVDRVVESLAASPLDVIALAFTSSAYKHGFSGEQALVGRLAAVARGLPITSTCLAAVAALRASGAQRIALINPPWFDEALDHAGADYFRSQDCNVVHHAPCGLPSGQSYITPGGLHDWISRVVEVSGADTVMVLGNGQRAVGVIAAAEADFGVTVFTANQLLLWHALELTGHDSTVTGYGRLFGIRNAN
jgi:maleate isomerase